MQMECLTFTRVELGNKLRVNVILKVGHIRFSSFSNSSIVFSSSLFLDSSSGSIHRPN